MKIQTSDEITEATESLALKLNEAIPNGVSHGVALGALAVIIGTTISTIDDLADKSEALKYCDDVIRKIAFAPRLNS